MKLGERMIMNFNEMLTMSGKVDFPQQSKCGVRVSIRMNMEPGQPSGLVVSAASSLSVPLPPLQVFTFLQKLDSRQQVLFLLYLFLDLHDHQKTTKRLRVTVGRSFLWNRNL